MSLETFGVSLTTEKLREVKENKRRVIKIYVEPLSHLLRQYFQSGEIEVVEGTTVKQFLDNLDNLGVKEEHRKGILTIIGKSIKKPDYVLRDGDEVLLAVAYSGG